MDNNNQLKYTIKTKITLVIVNISKKEKGTTVHSGILTS